MESFATELSLFFKWLLISTMQASVLICLVLAIKVLIRDRLVVRCHYWLWLLLLLRMAVPFAPESNLSAFNLISQIKKSVVAEEISKTKLGAGLKDATADVSQDITTKMTNIPRSRDFAKQVRTPSQRALTPHRTGLLSLTIIEVLALVWFVVALALVILALICNFRLWRIIKSQRPLTEGKILDLLEDCKVEIGVQTLVGVVVTDKVKSPALFGVIRPRLLLPEGLLETLSTEELRYVFIHELAHLKRHDIYLGWLMVVLQILHWFNPLVWFAFNRMRADRELACDGFALSTLSANESQAYGQTLVNLFKETSKVRYVPGMAAIVEKKSQFKRRIAMIAGFKNNSYKLSILGIMLVIMLAFFTLTDARSEQPEAVDINAMVAELDIDTATLDDVIYIFGEPLKYAWGRETIPIEQIPTDRYIMRYRGGFSILMLQDSIGELRFDSPAAGYVFHDEIRVGSSLDEVLDFLGEPMEIVEGEPIAWMDDVLYMDADGKEGRCYYQRSDWGVRMFFINYKVSALYVTSNSSPENKEILREEDLPPTSFIDEDGRIVDKVDYPFVDDPEVIGCWESVDFVSYIEDFDPNKRSRNSDLFFKEIFVFENGRTNLGITWTKGLFLDVDGKEASEYVIEEINGTKYMFFEWKTGDYRIYHIRPKFYVLKKSPRRMYVEARTYDKVDYPFVDDPEVIGTWEAIDFVETPEEFKPEEKQWRDGEMFLGQLVIEPNGQMSQILGKQVIEAKRAERKRERESLLKELGIDPDGTMSQILDKQAFEFDQAWTKMTGGSFLRETGIDPNAKISEILSKEGPYFKQALEAGLDESFLEKLTNPNTKISEIINKQLPSTKKVWTKGLIIEPTAKKASRYEIEEIDGSTYMFYEWKSGDYTLRQMKPKYYVLKKR